MIRLFLQCTHYLVYLSAFNLTAASSASSGASGTSETREQQSVMSELDQVVQALPLIPNLQNLNLEQLSHTLSLALAGSSDHSTTPSTIGGSSVKQLKCKYCEFSTPYQAVLKTHTRSHSGEKPFKCPFCNYCTGLKHNLETHLRTHTGEKPYSCPYCPYKCAAKGKLFHIFRNFQRFERTFPESLATYSILVTGLKKKKRSVEHKLPPLISSSVVA